jgi:hypothetical protein
MHHAATGSKAQGTANTGTRLAPTKLQYMMQKPSRRRGRRPQRQHTTTHTTCKQAEHVGAREHCQKQTAVVLYMHGSWPTTKGSTVSSTLAHAAITGTHKHTHRHTQHADTPVAIAASYTSRCPAPGLHATPRKVAGSFSQNVRWRLGTTTVAAKSASALQKAATATRPATCSTRTGVVSEGAVAHAVQRPLSMAWMAARHTISHTRRWRREESSGLRPSHTTGQ